MSYIGDLWYGLFATQARTISELRYGIYGASRDMRALTDTGGTSSTAKQIEDSIIKHVVKLNKGGEDLTPGKLAYAKTVLSELKKINPKKQEEVIVGVSATVQWGRLRAHIAHQWAADQIHDFASNTDDTTSVTDATFRYMPKVMGIFVDTSDVVKMGDGDKEVAKKFVNMVQGWCKNRKINERNFDVSAAQYFGKDGVLAKMAESSIEVFHRAALDASVAMMNAASSDFVTASKMYNDYFVSMTRFKTLYPSSAHDDHMLPDKQKLFGPHYHRYNLSKCDIAVEYSEDDRRKTVAAIRSFYFPRVGLYSQTSSLDFDDGIAMLSKYVAQEKLVLGKSWTADNSAANGLILQCARELSGSKSLQNSDGADLLEKIRGMGFGAVLDSVIAKTIAPKITATVVTPPVENAGVPKTGLEVQMDVAATAAQAGVGVNGSPSPVADTTKSEPAPGSLGGDTQLGVNTRLSDPAALPAWMVVLDSLHKQVMAPEASAPDAVALAQITALHKEMTANLDGVPADDRIRMAQIIASTALNNGKPTVVIGKKIAEGIQALGLDLSSNNVVERIFSRHIDAAVDSGQHTSDSAIDLLKGRLQAKPRATVDPARLRPDKERVG